MPLFAQITDSHLRADEPERVLKLRAGVDRILGLGVAPDAVLVTGDIADDGGSSEYEGAARELARLDVPLVVLPGNHDDRAGMRAAFGLPGEGEERLQSVSVHGGVRVVACDTLVPGSDGGDLDVAWIAERLAEDRLTPTVVAMHHPPYLVGIEQMDGMAPPADQRAELARVLEAAPNVIRVVAGHLHLTTAASVGGVVAVTASSVNIQLAPDYGTGLVAITDAQAGVMVHMLTREGMTSHAIPV